MFGHLEGHLLPVGLDIGVLQLLLDSAAADLAMEPTPPQPGDPSWGRRSTGAASDTASGSGNPAMRAAAAAFASALGSGGGGTGAGAGFGAGSFLSGGNGGFGLGMGMGTGMGTGSYGGTLRSGAGGFLATAGASAEEAQPDLAGLQREQLVRLCAPEELVADLTGLTIIGQGARSVTFQALWRGARVAVRFSSCSSAHPAASAVIRQALVSKALAHPNILQHYSIRCCRLAPASAAASGGGAASTATAAAAAMTAATAAATVTPAAATAGGSSPSAGPLPSEPSASATAASATPSAAAIAAANGSGFGSNAGLSAALCTAPPECLGEPRERAPASVGYLSGPSNTAAAAALRGSSDSASDSGGAAGPSAAAAGDADVDGSPAGALPAGEDCTGLLEATSPNSAAAAMAAAVAAAADMAPSASDAPMAPCPAQPAAPLRALSSPSTLAGSGLRPYRPPPCTHRLLTTVEEHPATSSSQPFPPSAPASAPAATALAAVTDPAPVPAPAPAPAPVTTKAPAAAATAAVAVCSAASGSLASGAPVSSGGSGPRQQAVMTEREQLLAELGLGPGQQRTRMLRPPPAAPQAEPLASAAGPGDAAASPLRPSPPPPSGSQVAVAVAAAAPAGAQAPPPLVGPGPGAGLAGSASPASLSFNSQEGFGNPSLRHALSLPHVAALVCAREGDLLTATIMEHADRSTLAHAVQRGLFSGARVWSLRVALRALLRTALEVAFALQHLHGRGITHGSLRPANVLLKSSNLDRRGFTAKVTNFSLARVCRSSEDASPPHSPTATATATAIAAAVTSEVAPTSEAALSSGAGGLGLGLGTGGGGGAAGSCTSGPSAVATGAGGGCGAWGGCAVLPEAVLPEAVLPDARDLAFMAPEQLRGAAGGKPSDVYAFGVTLLVMATAAQPYPGMGVAEVAAGVAAGTLRPCWPASLSLPPLKALCAACWEADPRARPSFTQVSAMLQAIEHDVRHQLRNPPLPPPAAPPAARVACVDVSAGGGVAAAAGAAQPLAARRVVSMALESEASAFSANIAAAVAAAATHSTSASISAASALAEAGPAAAGRDVVEEEGVVVGTL
ncbi:hypothetical protein HYH03_008707 [Edaphochlamys debaryana]|uniref:Protein kinase domain-containing protein n=1 Tax=Edaphochlamys debaryana TaxID=47281 RepID=A0A836BZ70_9CHLO|nr:hypothetical protein HYH03_008707 [Edaphochlamys debaryana]|eukprot:KAG2493044.1 hypothetical protein HYH03_008707 [Edaphochlamys debaryana]